MSIRVVLLDEGLAAAGDLIAAVHQEGWPYARPARAGEASDRVIPICSTERVGGVVDGQVLVQDCLVQGTACAYEGAILTYAPRHLLISSGIVLVAGAIPDDLREYIEYEEEVSDG